ncbi:MAG TPA: NADPH-dependent F420 reductase [Acidimicrobiales bacterium]|nr:NADPH-dependent F420 reductase [Acidimicrobiales bacterium]
MDIGVLGGTGPAGQAVALRLASAGLHVTMGSRSKERCVGICDGLTQQWAARELPLHAGDNAEAATADLVIVATPWDAAALTAGSVASALEGKVVVSMANAIVRLGDEFLPLFPPRGSIAAGVQAAVPGAFVAAALHHVPARELADLDSELNWDVLVCSDHAAALKATCEMINMVPGLRALDAGRLSSAAPIEALTPVLLQLNIRYKTHTSIRFTGIDHG